MKTALFVSILALIAVSLTACTQTSRAIAIEPITPSTADTSATEQTVTMDIADFAFANPDLHVKVGDTVVWTNQDTAPHTVTSDTGNELMSPTLSNGQSYSHTFTTAGTYAYHCTIHSMMKGTVTVE